MKKYLIAFSLLLLPLGVLAFFPSITYYGENNEAATIRFFMGRQSAEFYELELPHLYCSVMNYNSVISQYCVFKNE